MRGRYVKRIWQSDPTLYAPPRYRRPCSYDAFIPARLGAFDIALPSSVAAVLSEAERAILELNQVGGAELAPLARLLLRTESIASSKVEGMQVDARALARAEASQETGRRIGPQAAEILANIEAMELAVEHAAEGEGVQPHSLRAIHRALLAQDPITRLPGEFRHAQNWIGGNNYNPLGANYVPPPPEEVEQLIDDLCQFCNQEMYSPLLQAAVAHAQFESIHPFDDGNGRTGRALIQVILRRRGIAPRFVPPISVVFARQRERYIEALVRFREDGIAEWIEAFAAAAASAAQLARRYSLEVQRLQMSWREQLRLHTNPRSDAAAWAIIDILPAHSMLAVSIAAAATRRTRPAITNAIIELQNAGVLAPLNLSERNRIWEAVGLLDLIVALESWMI
jgi:Fic family protein